MIGLNFLTRLVQLVFYCGVGLLVLSLFTLGISWMVRMAVEAHMISFGSHFGWFFSVPLRAARAAWREIFPPKSRDRE